MRDSVNELVIQTVVVAVVQHRSMIIVVLVLSYTGHTPITTMAIRSSTITTSIPEEEKEETSTSDGISKSNCANLKIHLAISHCGVHTRQQEMTGPYSQQILWKHQQLTDSTRVLFVYPKPGESLMQLIFLCYVPHFCSGWHVHSALWAWL